MAYRVQRLAEPATPEQRRAARRQGGGRVWVTVCKCHTIAGAERAQLNLRTDGYDIVRIVEGRSN
jgi:hypothetical protein